MADSHLDIGRIIMQANYLQEMDKSSASEGLSDMERKQYQDQIRELVQTVQTLLQANITLGQKQKDSEEKARKDREASEQKISELQAKLDKLEGEVKSRRRKQHGKSSEKQSKGQPTNASKTKDEVEEEYIENGCQQPSESEEDAGCGDLPDFC